jgi:tRNA A37 threonylcarbamoyladenosine biosynthesis protein TsaE
LDNVAELDELGLAEERDDHLTLVEWAERAGPSYMRPSYNILIQPQPDGSRILTLNTDKHDTSN